MIQITLPGGQILNYEKGITPKEIADKIAISLGKKAIAAKFNDEYVELNRKLFENGDLTILTQEDKDSLDVLNHSTAHLFAQAIKRMYPHAKFGVGPAIEEGFYYDVDFGDDKFTQDKLVEVEKVMNTLVKENWEIVRHDVTYEQAVKLFSNDEYKLELIEGFKDSNLSVYTQGEFTDLCRGGHVASTSKIKNFKLLSVAGAYWRGNSDNKQLTRIYGTAFFNKQALDDHLKLIEERKLRDHKKLGRELELFMFSEFGPGFPFMLPNGVTMKNLLLDYWKKVHIQHGYLFIETPAMLNRDLWELSGHWDNYQENMYISEIDDKKFAIKPMNCPGSILIYKKDLYSYRDLPLRMAELGQVHRHEASGALNGLFRVRAFTQDDAHIYITQDQIEAEIIRIIQFIEEVYSVFGLTYSIELSTRPEENYIGDIAVWDKSEEALKNACIKAGKEYIINEGDGAFYGPKLDFKIKDSLNRVWQCGTVQLDMNLPERFDLNYIDEHGKKVRPVMLHRVIFGSVERFMGILIEHFGGVFPLWLSPEQVRVIPVNLDAHTNYANELIKILNNNNFRTKLDDREEKLGYKIREAQTSKVPYQIVLGDNEVANNTITYRQYGQTQQITISIEEFIEQLKNKSIIGG